MHAQIYVCKLSYKFKFSALKITSSQYFIWCHTTKQLRQIYSYNILVIPTSYLEGSELKNDNDIKYDVFHGFSHSL
jgi:hypothetical protein